jgi:hypothetical protein
VLDAKADSGTAGALTLAKLVELRPVVVDGKVVALESIHPPGAVRIMGAAMWSPCWLERIPDAADQATRALTGP